MQGVVLHARPFPLLCVVGLHYPLQMLPVLLWGMIWKTLWLVLNAFTAVDGASSRSVARADDFWTRVVGSVAMLARVWSGGSLVYGVKM
jgi:hypothetical protein